MCAAAAAAGWNVKGIDFTDDAVRRFNPDFAAAVEVGDAYALLDAYLEADERFDACVLTNVLEHVLDPENLLRGLARILSHQGVLVITVPNDYSRLQEKLIERSPIDCEFWFCPPAHLNYFNTVTVQELCRREGLEVLDLCGGFPVDFFLLHPASNYVRDASQGKAAHLARVTADLLMAEHGMEAFHRYFQGLAGCGMGRTVTVIAGPGRVAAGT